MGDTVVPGSECLFFSSHETLCLRYTNDVSAFLSLRVSSRPCMEQASLLPRSQNQKIIENAVDRCPQCQRPLVLARLTRGVCANPVARHAAAAALRPPPSPPVPKLPIAPPPPSTTVAGDGGKRLFHTASSAWVAGENRDGKLKGRGRMGGVGGRGWRCWWCS